MYSMFMIWFCLYLTTEGHVHIFRNLFSHSQISFFSQHLPHICSAFKARSHAAPHSSTHSSTYIKVTAHSLWSRKYFLPSSSNHSITWCAKSATFCRLTYKNGILLCAELQKRQKKKLLMVGTKTTCSQNSKPTVLVIYDHLIRGL